MDDAWTMARDATQEMLGAVLRVECYLENAHWCFVAMSVRFLVSPKSLTVLSLLSCAVSIPHAMFPSLLAVE